MTSKEHRLLLRAALLEGEPAVRAWRTWRAAVDLDRVDPASQQLFPLLFANLRQHSIEDRWLGRLKGHYRRSWYSNQLVLSEVRRIAYRLKTVGIEALPAADIRGVLDYYPDPALRPLSHPAILVSPDRLADAIEELQRDGYVPAPHFPRSLSSLHLVVRHSYSLRRGHEHLTITWREGPVIHPETVIRSAPGEARTAETHLLQIASRFGRPSRGDLLDIADAYVLISGPRTLDWGAVYAAARERGQVEKLARLVRRLQNALDVPTPRMPGAGRESGESRTVARGQAPGWWPVDAKRLLHAWAQYRHLAVRGVRVGGFLGYLRIWWGLDSRSEVVIKLMYTVLRFAGDGCRRCLARARGHIDDHSSVQHRLSR